MVRTGNGYGNRGYRDLERWYARIERGPSDHTTCTPEKETHHAGREDDEGDDDDQVFGVSKPSGRIDEGEKSDRNQCEGDRRKGHRVDRELWPIEANQHQQRRSEKRGQANRRSSQPCSPQSA